MDASGGPGRGEGRADLSRSGLSNSGATLTAMGKKLSPSGTKAYTIIKRIPAAIYNYWKTASDYGIFIYCFYVPITQ
jgi:hypothetical protein